MGEIANPGAALGAGLNSGAQFGQAIVGANREREQHGLDQASRQAAAGAIPNAGGNFIPAGDPNANAQNHTGFLASLGQGLASIGSGIANHFANPITSGAPPAALPPPTQLGGLQAMPQPGVQQLPSTVQGLMNGGPVGQASALPAPGGMAGNSALPTPAPMTAPAAVGAIPGSPTVNAQGGVAMLEGGGPMPNTGEALGAGLNSGAQFGQSVIGAQRESEQHGLDQASRQAVASAIPDTPGAGTGQDHPVEQFAAHLHDSALNDAGVPNGKAGIAAPTPQGQLAQAAQNPASQQGIPEQPKGGDPSTPHSLSPQFWDDSDAKLLHAAKAAALAGHDPDQAYQALNHLRTSFVQGHMLRNLSAASVALQNGNMKGVEEGLRNMNYYLPDGKDLEVQKDDQGNLTYQDPISPYIDKDGNPVSQKDPNAKPNMIPVDQQHLQMLGMAVLDPMKVNDTIVAARGAAAKQALERAQTQAQITNSQARAQLAKTRDFLSKSTSIKNLSDAQLAQARAAAGGFALRRWQVAAGNQKLDPGMLNGAKQAASAVDDALLGNKTAVATEDKDGNPSLSPAAGKVVHDPASVPKELQGVTPLAAGDIKANAGDIYIANAKSGMSHWAAAQLALKMYTAKGQTHRGPDGTPQPNYYVHRESGEGGVWNPQTKKYDKFAMPQSTMAAELDGQGKFNEDEYMKGAMGSLQGGGQGASDSDNADDFITAKEPGEQ